MRNVSRPLEPRIPDRTLVSRRYGKPRSSPRLSSGARNLGSRSRALRAPVEGEETDRWKQLPIIPATFRQTPPFYSLIHRRRTPTTVRYFADLLTRRSQGFRRCKYECDGLYEYLHWYFIVACICIGIFYRAKIFTVEHRKNRERN